MSAVTLFEEKQVRRAWNQAEEKWYFAIVDVIAVLTESIDAGGYWRKLKERLKKDGNETVTNCHGLKMTAADGNIAGNARKELEAKSGTAISTKENFKSRTERDIKTLYRSKPKAH